MVPHASPQTRQRTFMERQPYIVAYGGVISIFAPTATAYQLCRLYKLNVALPQLFRMAVYILPHQVALKALQMNASTPVKDYLNPWAAFATVGVLQGGVYGQANVYFSRALKLGKVASLAGIFRGSAFAGARDCTSQGIPFMFSDSFRKNVADKIYPTTPEDVQVNFVKRWSSLISTSVAATYLSQGMHNFQTAMQADQSLGYAAAVRSVMKEHGFAIFMKGAEARVGLLLLVNVLNELLLKPAWEPFPYSQDQIHLGFSTVLSDPETNAGKERLQL